MAHSGNRRGCSGSHRESLALSCAFLLSWAGSVRAWEIVTVDAAGDVGAFPSLAVVAGRPAVSYRDDGASMLRYVRATDPYGTTWGAPVIVAPMAAANGMETSLGVVDGRPAIAYPAADGKVLAFVRANDAEGTSWGPPVTVASCLSFCVPTMAVVDGNPAIAYFDAYPLFILQYVRAMDAQGSAWGAPVLLGDGGWYRSMQVVDGRPAISYEDLNAAWTASYVRASDVGGSAWPPPRSFDQGNEAGTSLAIVHGRPAIGYWTHALQYRRALDDAGDAWGPAVPVAPSPTRIGAFTSLAVVDGSPSIAYYRYDGSSRGALMFVRERGVAARWSTPVVVDGSGDAGYHARLADVNGAAGIVYRDELAGDLRYAVCRRDGVRYAVGKGHAAANDNLVRLLDAAGSPAGVDFYAYGSGVWGTSVRAGDIGDGCHAHVLTGPGPGPVFGPQVRAFTRAGTSQPGVNFYAYGTLKYGVNVAHADVDSDGLGEILTGPGAGSVFGPHVRGWNHDGASAMPMPALSFFAYGSLMYGAVVAGGDLEGDSYDEVLTGPGPGGQLTAHVRGWDFDGASIAALQKVSFIAFPYVHGARVGAVDYDGDGNAEIAAAPGPGPGAPARIRTFDVDGSTPGSVIALPGATVYGATLGAADVTGDGSGDLLAGAGQDPSAGATVSTFTYAGGSMQALATFDAFPGSAYGVNVHGGNLEP